MKEILAGDSFFVVIEFNASYNTVVRLTDASVYFNNMLIGTIQLGGIDKTSNAQVYEIEISNVVTANLQGLYALRLDVEDTLLGLQRLPLYAVSVLTSADVAQAQNSRLNDVRFVITMYNSYLVSRVVLLTPVRNISAYELAVLNGYQGTLSQYNANFGQRVATVQITNKKDGDILNHNLVGEVVITGFVPLGEKKPKFGFWADNIDNDEFVLRTGMPAALIAQEFTGHILIEKYKD